MTSVWYLGVATERVISAAEWTAVGAPGATARWDSSNGWSLPLSAFTIAQVAILDSEALFNTNAPDGPRPGPGVEPEEVPWRDRLVLRESIFDEDGKLLESLLPPSVLPLEDIVEAVVAALPESDYAALLRNVLSGGTP